MMETREDILKELKEIAPKLASLDKTNSYKLPEYYFLNFKNGILEKVKLNMVREELKVVAPSLSGLEKKFSVEVPVTYFGNFSGDLLKKIRANEVAAELSEIAPALSKLEKVNAVTVPADYFGNFAANLLQEINKKAQPAGVPFQSQWLSSLNEILERAVNVIFQPKYTLAFTGMATMIIIGVMMFVKVEQSKDLDSSFAQLTTSEINNYLDNKSDAYSDEVFEGKFDEKPMPAADKQNSLPIKDALKDVDDAALNEAITD
jgi:hypothetical protein